MFKFVNNITNIVLHSKLRNYHIVNYVIDRDVKTFSLKYCNAN